MGAVAAFVALVGCGPGYARREVVSEPLLTVTLRAQQGDDGLVDRGYQHPITIAAVRLTHVLSHVDVRESVDHGGTRRPALPADLLFPAGEGIARALARATPAEEVVVQGLRKERRLGLFSTEYLTTLVVYAKDDRLFIHVRHLDSEISKDPRDDALPEPFVERRPSSFRLVSGEAMVAVGPQDVSVDWRDPVFRRPDRIRVGRGGRIQRRTVLMESEPEEEAPDPLDERSGRLSPRTLRELADLEEERRAGRLTEGEYEARRKEILATDPASH